MNKKLEEILSEEFYSPYKVAKIESNLREKQIPPQKLYGYVRMGYIVSSTNSTGKLQISREDVFKYLEKFVK